MIVSQIENDMPQWPPGTRLYFSEVGQHYAVQADEGMNEGMVNAISAALPSFLSGAHRVNLRPTTVLLCDNNGNAHGLTPLYTAPPGTSHEEALEALGFTTD